MTNLKLHEDCKALSQAVYDFEKPKIINGWRYLKTFQDDCGFYAEAYEKNGKVILAIRGTDTERGKIEKFKDVLDSDVPMGLTIMPYQTKYAEDAYKKLVQEYGKNNVILTGHSLGGSIDIILGTKYGSETVTFSAYGVKYISGLEQNYTQNITNYGNAADGIFLRNIDSLIGKTMVLNTNGEGESFKHEFEYKPQPLKPHLLESFGDLSKGVEYSGIDISEPAPLFKAGIEYVDYVDNTDYLDKIFDTKNRILYRGEVKLDDLDDELCDLYLDQFFDDDFFPTKQELDERVHNGDVIYVEQYRRSDGTVVSGYYRSYPKN